MKVKSESEVAQLCPTLSNLMDCRLPGSSVHGIFQARVLEWGAIAFSVIMLTTCIKYQNHIAGPTRIPCLHLSASLGYMNSFSYSTPR